MRTILFGDEKRLLPFSPISVCTDHMQEPRKRPDGAPFCHLLFALSGEGVIECEGRSHPFRAGEVAFIDRDLPSSYYAVEKSELRTGWITFDGAGIESLRDYFLVGRFAIGESERLLPLLQQCHLLAESKAPPEEISVLLYEMLLRFFSAQRGARRSAHLKKAKAYIRAHLTEDLSVETMAAAVGISPSLLYRLFRKEENTTPIYYLRRVRIRRAKQLLAASPQKKIAEVAAECGFFDCAYFCKVFKSETGLTPGGFVELYVEK